jgi:hypothetical protein
LANNKKRKEVIDWWGNSVKQEITVETVRDIQAQKPMNLEEDFVVHETLVDKCEPEFVVVENGKSVHKNKQCPNVQISKRPISIVHSEDGYTPCRTCFGKNKRNKSKKFQSKKRKRKSDGKSLKKSSRKRKIIPKFDLFNRTWERTRKVSPLANQKTFVLKPLRKGFSDKKQMVYVFQDQSDNSMWILKDQLDYSTWQMFYKRNPERAQLRLKSEHDRSVFRKLVGDLINNYDYGIIVTLLKISENNKFQYLK